jgi:ELWxxDGT repeat protein
MVALVSGAPPRRGGRFSYVVIAVLIGAMALMAATPAAATVGLVKAIGPGSDSSGPQSLTSLGNKLLFTVRDARNGQGHGRELWKSDGTAAGTKLLKDIYPGPPSSDPDRLTRLGGLILFTASSPNHGRELWKSDGTAAGTKMVKDIFPGDCPVGERDLAPCSGDGFYLTKVGDRIFYSAMDLAHGEELWKTDGTATGTKLVKDIWPGSEFDSAGSHPYNLAAVGGALFFQADDGVNGRELWTSDGTTAGTQLVKDINPGPDDSFPASLADVGGELFFSALDPTVGRELWKSNGTGIGTQLVKDINPTGDSFGVGEFFADVGGTLFFSPFEPTTGQELWTSDGTELGTQLFKDINPGSGSSGAGPLVSFAGQQFFGAVDATHGRELWKSDGTPSGTKLVRDISPGAGSGAPSWLLDVGGTLFFQACGSMTGCELWKSDGTTNGTKLVKDIRPSGSSSPSLLTSAGGKLFFRAFRAADGNQLWKAVP